MRQQTFDQPPPSAERWTIASAASRFASHDREEDTDLLARSRRQIAESRRLLALPILRPGPHPSVETRM